MEGWTSNSFLEIDQIIIWPVSYSLYVYFYMQICLVSYAYFYIYANMSSLIRWKYKEDYVRSALQAQLCCLLAYLCKTMQESCSSSKLADIRQFQKDDIIRCFYPRVSSIDSLISSLLKLIIGWSRTWTINRIFKIGMMIFFPVKKHEKNKEFLYMEVLKTNYLHARILQTL